MKKIGIFAVCLFLPAIVQATTWIESHPCYSCNATKAKDLALTKYDKPRCHFGDIGGGPAVIDETPVYCDPTTKNIVILDPESRRTWKFKVRANSPEPGTVNATATSMTVSGDEHQTAELFFNFHNDLQNAVPGNTILINPEEFLNQQSSNLHSPKQTSFASFVEASSETSASCHAVSEYYDGSIGQEAVSNYVERSIIEHLNTMNLNPNDLNEDMDMTGLGVHLDGRSVGLNIQWDVNENSTVAIVGDSENRLVFRLGFHGVVTNQSYKLHAVELSLDRGTSKIDGMTHAVAFMDGVINEVNNTTADDEQCRRELAKKQAQEQNWGAYVGPGLDSPNIIEPISPGICARTVSMRTCSTSNGQTTCTETVYSFPERCF